MDNENMPTAADRAALRPDRPTLLYDDGCRFCRAMAEVFCRLARRRDLAFLPWSSELALGWMANLRPEVRDRSMHLKLPDGSLVSGNRVFPETLGYVRGTKWLAWVAGRVPLVATCLAWVYGFVAGHRDPLARFVPDRPPVVRQPRVQ